MDKISVALLKQDEIMDCDMCPLRMKTLGTLYYVLNGSILCHHCANQSYIKFHNGEDDFDAK